MSAKRKDSPVETIRDAAIGYTTVVLGVVCFLLALVVIMAGVRFIRGISAAPAATTTQAAIAATQNEGETT